MISKKLNSNIFIPEKSWVGVVTELKLNNNCDKLESSLYDYIINIINFEENSIQVSISYKRISDSKFQKEFANLYIFEDGSIKGQDMNGFLDGKIIEKNDQKIMEICYRSLDRNKKFMLSYYGQLKFKG